MYIFIHSRCINMVSLKYFIGFASGRYLSYLDQKGLLKVFKNTSFYRFSFRAEIYVLLLELITTQTTL